MASRETFDDLLDSMKREVDACFVNTKVPQKFREIAQRLQEKARDIAQGSSSGVVQADHISKFRDLLNKTTKKLKRLAKSPKHLDEWQLEGLKTSLDDMNNLHFRMKSQDGSSLSAAAIFTNLEAKTFWCDSFGSKVCIS